MMIFFSLLSSSHRETRQQLKMAVAGCQMLLKMGQRSIVGLGLHVQQQEEDHSRHIITAMTNRK
jgi:hypothetical protein